MKTLLTILVLALSLTTACKKSDKKPNEQPKEQPPPPSPKTCTSGDNIFVGAYYNKKLGPQHEVDTCYISFIENTCPEKQVLQIENLSAVLANLGVTVEDRDYYVPIDPSNWDWQADWDKNQQPLPTDTSGWDWNSGSIPDTLKMFFPQKAVHISVMQTGGQFAGEFSPYLQLMKR